MSSFTGTIEDFDRFLMPRIRNRIQTLARPYKNQEDGICQHCGKENGTLEAAHVHGRERKTIVREVLEGYREGDVYRIGDLDAFELEVVEAHEPICDTFLFLCHDCHREYDSEAKVGADAKPSAHSRMARHSGKPVSMATAETSPAGRFETWGMYDGLDGDFYNYLLESGYTEYTKSGNRGTAYSYRNAVCKVCGWEGCSLEQLAEVAHDAARDYSQDGIKAERGNTSNGTVRNALVAFDSFCALRLRQQ